MSKTYSKEEIEQAELAIRIMRGEVKEWQALNLTRRWDTTSLSPIKCVDLGYLIRITPYSMPQPPEGMEYQNPENVPLIHPSFRGMRLLVAEEYDGRFNWYSTIQAKTMSLTGEVIISSHWSSDRDKLTYCVPRDTPFPEIKKETLAPCDHDECGKTQCEQEKAKEWTPRYKVGDRVSVLHSSVIWTLTEVPSNEDGAYSLVRGLSKTWAKEQYLTPHVWTLPTPPDGMSWHRSDGWKEDMLPEGWRPLLRGELGDYQLSEDGVIWRNGVFGYMPVRQGCISWCRTKRPLPVSAARFEERVEEPDYEAIGRAVVKLVKGGTSV